MPTVPPQTKGILEFLDFNNNLRTPAFQRSFAWGRPQVDDFWNDLKRALDAPTGSEDYFLGLVVLDDSDEIQDGQQRLATTLLLAAEMQKLIEAARSSGPHNAQVATDALAQIAPALRQSPSAPLVVSAQDQDVLLNRAGIRSDLPESAKRLEAARGRLRFHLEGDLSQRTTPDAKLGRLKQWGEFLRGQAYTVLLRVPPKDAHNIFETLNTRGVRLTNGDLVKSHLIARATDVSLAVLKWNQITETLKDSSGKYEDDLESFLLHYYGSRFGKTTKAEFFTDYRREIESADALATLDELLASADLYRALADPEAVSSFWAQLGSGTQQAAELLNGLGLKQLRYLLLAVLRDFASRRALAVRRQRRGEAVRKIAAWSVRGLVHGQTGGGDAERTYITAAKEIREGNIQTVDELRAWFIQRDMLVLDNALFKQNFKAFQFDSKFSHNRARAVLYALEYWRISDKSGLRPRETLTLEHVLPQSPKLGQWTQFTSDARTAYTYNLGNLLLIDGPSGANNQLGASTWPEKRALIRSWGDQTPLTTEAVTRRDWTPQTIERRNEALAALAVRAWSA
ncbi:MAG: DUF262 domain-containing HNH endonuclease family protein [Actinomycetota bacterium]|nr:DUF262 domain-containing HNH endonuclease family protein [Actinomycetota bacterium]